MVNVTYAVAMEINVTNLMTGSTQVQKSCKIKWGGSVGRVEGRGRKRETQNSDFHSNEVVIHYLKTNIS